MSHGNEAESSKRSGGDKMMGPRKQEGKLSHDIAGPSLYRLLFPETSHTSPLLDVFSTKQQDNQSRSEVLTLDLPKVTQVHFHTMKKTSCLPKGEDINANEATDMNVQVQMSNNVPVSAYGTSSWFPNTAETVQQITLMNYGRSQPSYLSSHAPGPAMSSLEDLADIIAVQQVYLCALTDPDQITPMKLLQRSPDALKNHYSHDTHLRSHSGESPMNAAFQQPQRIYGFLPMQRPGQDNINRSSTEQQRMMYPVDNTFRIISVKGQIADLCANAHGSRLIQHVLETATVDEIIMVYEEMIPYAQMLSTHIFANFAVQKLLEHGPEFYKRKFISNLIGHVLPLSLNMYGSRVLQKAFEVANQNLKLQMAIELHGKVLECARDQYGNYVLQKCMECVPTQHIQFIFRSFHGNAKALSTTLYGCHVIQKVLTFCNNSQIYRALMSEITEAVVKLAADQYGNYVVQHIVEYGGSFERSALVKKMEGHVLSMSYKKYASIIIEKCLTYGNFRDRQLITTEIFTASDGEHFDHLLDMMCHIFANFVIRKLVMWAEERQLRLLVGVANRNIATIKSYPNGELVLAHIQNVLTLRGMPSDIRIADPPAAEE